MHLHNPITTAEQAMAFIYGTSWKGSKPGLSRVSELMRRLGDPQKSLKIAHIAGTNGKGSTAAMLASILMEAGHKVGLFTSPYIHCFGELVQVNGVPLSDEELISLTDEIQPHANAMEDSPTEFELITAIALLHFSKLECFVVLEVGMGGRLDSTNVIDTPEVAVITAIGLDHMEYLGNTPEKIAVEKCGIIKPGGVVVCHPQSPEVEAVIREKCRSENAYVTFVDADTIVEGNADLSGQTFDYNMETTTPLFSNGEKSSPFGKSIFTTENHFTIPLLGQHQLKNAAVAIEAAHVLSKNRNISANHIKRGLAKTTWPARFEVLSQDPVFIVDVAHNPQGIQSALETLRRILPGKKPIFIFGVLADKDYEAMTALLAPEAKAFICVAPDSPRALPGAELAVCVERYCSRLGTIVSSCICIEDGVALAMESVMPGDVICVLGSVALVGRVRACFTR